MQYKGLVACRAGVGSSLMLKIKLNQVIKEHDLPIKIEHGSLDSIMGFNGHVIITLSDVAKELEAKKLKQKIVGIDNIMNKIEIFDKLEKFLAEENIKE